MSPIRPVPAFRVLSLLPLAALLLAPPPASAQTAEELVAKSIVARGGIEKLRALKSLSLTGKQSVQGFEVPFTIRFARPNRMRVEATVQGQTIIQAFDGVTAWTIMPLMGSKEPEAVTGDEAKSMAEQADFDGPLVDMKEKGNKLRLLGKEDVDGTEAWKLEVTRKDEEITYIYLDPETFLEIKQKGRRKVSGKVIEIESYPSNYKSVDGMMMAHAVESRMDGQVISNIVIEKFETNVAIDEKSFTMPPKAPGTAAPAPAGSAAPAPKEAPKPAATTAAPPAKG